MRIDIATLFVEMCESVVQESIVGRSVRAGKVDIRCHNIRDYSSDKHRRVDDSPYGGGSGMVLQCEPVYRCVEGICAQLTLRPHVIYMSPQGRPLTQARVRELAMLDNLLILCGHYEGVDQRVLDCVVDEEISIGDYVITGGELAALVLADAVCRLCDGVLASEESYTEESHYDGLLEYPHYTKPAEWRGKQVPEVLLSGHHANIRTFRREKSLENTLRKRPDLLEKAVLDEKDRKILAHMVEENP